MDHRTACEILVRRQPQHRFRVLRHVVIVIVERCRSCREPWPCLGRRQARHATRDTLNQARHP
jgi:hypothetical protein